MIQLFPRACVVAAVATMLAGALFAQVNNVSLEVSSVIHNPTVDEAGPYLVANTPIGNGKKYDNDLPRISNKLFALANTTTHDLIVIHNGSSVDLVFEGRRNAPNMTMPVLVSSKPKYDNPAKPEAIMPTNTLQQVWGFDQSIVVPAGSTVPLILFVTQWAPALDTSPRDYVLTFGMWEVSQTTPRLFTFEAELTIPSNTGGRQNSVCAANPYGGPAGTWLLAVCGMAAILPRGWRKLRDLLR